jgi:hypothetical protein
MFDINHLKVDPSKSQEGVWVDYLRGSQLKVARASNKQAEDHRFREAVEHADIFNAGGDKAEKLAFEIETYTLAHYVLLDWSGIEQDGEELEYSPEIGMQILADPMFNDFREDLLRIARNREHFRVENEQAAIKAAKTTAAS